MKLKSIQIWLSDFIWLKIFGGHSLRKQKEERSNLVVERILSFFDEDEPYCLDGKWNWYFNKDTNEHIPVTMLLIDRSTCVMVYGPEVGNWEECRKYCRNKEEWTKANEQASLLEYVCPLVKMNLLNIKWNDPIDIASLRLKFGILDNKVSLS